MRLRDWVRGLLGTRWWGPRPTTDPERLEAIRAMYARYREAFPDVPEIQADELIERLAAGDPLVLVDVRDAHERAVSTIEGAISREAYEAEPPAGPVVAFCTIGARSGAYARELRRRGVDAHNLAGSLLAWTHAGGALVDADGPTRRVHVYGPPWDLAASPYQAEW